MTEHELHSKNLCAKVLTSTYEKNLLSLNRSKAFDTFRRGMSLDKLKKTIDKDQYNLIILLLKDIKLSQFRGNLRSYLGFCCLDIRSCW